MSSTNRIPNYLFILRISGLHTDTILTTTHITMSSFQTNHGSFTKTQKWSFTSYLAIGTTTGPYELDQCRCKIQALKKKLYNRLIIVMIIFKMQLIYNSHALLPNGSDMAYSSTLIMEA